MPVPFVAAVMFGMGGGRTERTNTWKVAFAVAPPLSVTWRTMSFSPAPASHAAVISALIEPLLLVIDVMVMPLGTLIAVTVNAPALSSASLTVAIIVVVAGSPWFTLMGDAAVIVGAVFAAALAAMKDTKVPARMSVRLT